MKLFFREVGAGQPVVVMHGVFGSADNWLTQARMMSEKYRVITIDLRNHGQSEHSDVFDYPAMAEDLRQFIEEQKLENPIVIGHSMGGKVAMNFAVAHSEMLEKLIVVDIAPRAYNLKHYVILDGLKAIPIDTLQSRQQADEVLAQYVEEPDVRQFLLKNLQRKPEGGFTWKLNLDVIDKNFANVGVPLQHEGTFDKPALFIRGSRSNYVRDEDIPGIKSIFPKAEVRSLDTGHWVQAEKPVEFVSMVMEWLAAN